MIGFVAIFWPFSDRRTICDFLLNFCQNNFLLKIFRISHCHRKYDLIVNTFLEHKNEIHKRHWLNWCLVKRIKDLLLFLIYLAYMVAKRMPMTFCGCFNGCFDINLFGISIIVFFLKQISQKMVSKLQFSCAHLDKQAFISNRLGFCLLKQFKLFTR